MRVSVKDGEFVFSSPLAKSRFMKLAEGKEVSLELMEKPTDTMRKYFEGCLVPAFFYAHPRSAWENFADAREVLKLEFSPMTRQVVTLKGEVVKIPPSVATLSKARFTSMVEAIVEWMLENGVPSEVLDSDAYIRWRDTNFDDPVYPPLRRMKERYERERKEA